MLAEVVKDVKEKVLEGADIKNSAFYSRVYSTNAHAQHPPKEPTFGAMDNFTRLMLLEREEADKQRYSKDPTSLHSRTGRMGVHIFRRLWALTRWALHAMGCCKIKSRSKKHRVATTATTASSSSIDHASLQKQLTMRSYDLESGGGQGGYDSDDWSQEGRGSDAESEDHDAAAAPSSKTPFSQPPDAPPVDPPGDLLNKAKPSSRLSRSGSIHFSQMVGHAVAEKYKKAKQHVPLAEVLTMLRRDTDEMDGHYMVDSHYEPVQPDAFIR